MMPKMCAWFSLVLLAGCVKSNDITVRTSEMDQRSTPEAGDDYDFQPVPSDAYSRQNPGFFAVHGEADWVQAFKRDDSGNAPPLPSGIDWKTHMLFVATSKTPGAKSIEVQKITRTFDGLHIYVLETLPAASCPVEPTARLPMEIVSLDNVPLDLHVVYDRVHAETCGPPPDAVVTCRVAGSGAPGEAKITASPGEMIECDSSQARPRVGAIGTRSWQLGALPPGSATKLTVGKGEMTVSFPVDAWGVYQIDLTVRDAAREGSALALVEVLPPAAGVELYFEHADRLDPATLPRTELHVVESPHGLGSAADCSLKAARDFCDVHTAVSMQQAALTPEPKQRYRVMVRYLDARLPGAPTACVRVFSRGVVPTSVCDAGGASRGRGAVWNVGLLDLEHASISDAPVAHEPAPARPAPHPAKPAAPTEMEF